MINPASGVNLTFDNRVLVPSPPRTETLVNLSTLIRQRRALRLKARALTAESKASAAVISITPFVAGAGLYLVKPDMMSLLFVDHRGRFMLGIAIGSLLLGIATMGAIIRRTLR